MFVKKCYHVCRKKDLLWFLYMNYIKENYICFELIFPLTYYTKAFIKFALKLEVELFSSCCKLIYYNLLNINFYRNAIFLFIIELTSKKFTKLVSQNIVKGEIIRLTCFLGLLILVVNARLFKDLLKLELCMLAAWATSLFSISMFLS